MMSDSALSKATVFRLVKDNIVPAMLLCSKQLQILGKAGGAHEQASTGISISDNILAVEMSCGASDARDGSGCRVA
jgi:hypothetical protein